MDVSVMIENIKFNYRVATIIKGSIILVGVVNSNYFFI